MTRNLRDKVILISGASSGIGRATALAAAWAGMHVSVAARRLDRLENVARKVSDLNRRCHYFTANVAHHEDVKRWVQEAHQTFGRIDAVFANAGFGHAGPALDMPLSAQHALFDVNYFGTVHLLREAYPYLAHTPDGLKHLLVCSSCLSELGPPESGVYAATKAAQDCLAQSLRAELAPQGFSVTSVHPVGTKTEFFDQARAQSANKTPVDAGPRWLMQSPEKVADRVVKALKKPRPEVWPMPAARYLAALATACPRLTAWTLQKQYDRQRKAHR